MSNQKPWVMPPTNYFADHRSALRLKAHPGYEHDILIIDGQQGDILARIRFDRDARAWLRTWLDHMDEQSK